MKHAVLHPKQAQVTSTMPTSIHVNCDRLTYRKIESLDFKWVKSCLGEIEKKFGRKWLETQLSIHKIATDQSHLLPFHWNRVHHIITHYSNVTELANDCSSANELAGHLLSICRTCDYARDLSIARTLPNHEVALPREKLNSYKTFSDYMYQARVARFFNEENFQTQFLIESKQKHIKTPDLHAIKPPLSLYAECKNKNIFSIDTKTKSLINLVTNKVNANMKQVLGRVHLDCEVILCISSSISQKGIDSVVQEIADLACDSFEGIKVFGNSDGMIVMLQNPFPARTPGVMRLPYWLSNAFILEWPMPRSITEDGRAVEDARKMNSYFSFSSLAINSHSVKQIMSSFDKAKSQLPDRSSGIVYINVDCPLIEDFAALLYRKMFEIVVQQKFYTHKNTRIYAVVLTLENPRVLSCNPKGELICNRHVFVVRNPNSNLGNNIKVPGEDNFTSNFLDYGYVENEKLKWNRDRNPMLKLLFTHKF